MWHAKKKKHCIHAVFCNCVTSLCVMVLDPHSHLTIAVRFILGPGFCCLAFGEGHWEWLVEVQWKMM